MTKIVHVEHAYRAGGRLFWTERYYCVFVGLASPQWPTHEGEMYIHGLREGGVPWQSIYPTPVARKSTRLSTVVLPFRLIRAKEPYP